MAEQRKLAAIMFTDIQDFTRRMSADESVGMALLKEHNAIMDAAVRNHHGKVVKNIGDSYLVDFGSAVNAVEAAIEAQRLFGEHNRGKTSSQQILVRISIHLGDIVVKGDDVFGDGVNIASRLQSITPAGGICTSREVINHAKSKVPFQGASIGTHDLKGIPEPVEVYQIFTSIVPEPYAVPSSRPVDKKGTEGLSIAVLPFANWSEDKENEYFSDGITEDIITDLAKISSLRVSSRNSVFNYKGKTVDIQKVGTDLNVRYVLEGSVRKAGNRLRITAQLIEAGTNVHLWAERYDRQLEDIFAIQDEISQNIAKELRIRLTQDQELAISKRETKSLEAYDLYLKGLFHSRKRTKADLDQAVELLNGALNLDPQFAAAHSALAFAHRFKYSFGLDRDPAVLTEATAHTERALAIDPRSSEALLMKGLLLREAGDQHGAIKTLRQLIATSPNFVQGYAYLGNAYRDVGIIDRCVEYHLRAMELDPMDFFHAYNLSIDYSVLHDIPNLREMVDRAFRIAPNHFLVWMMKGMTAAFDGKESEALEFINTAIKLDPHHHDTYGLRAWIYSMFDKPEECYRDLCHMLEHGNKSGYTLITALPYMVHLRKFDDARRIIEDLLTKTHVTDETGRDAKSDTYLYRGMILKLEGNEAAAAEDFKKSLEIIERKLAEYPESRLLRIAHSLVAAVNGEFQQSEADLQAILADRPGNPDVAFELARVAALKGDLHTVVQWIGRAREYGKRGNQLMIQDVFLDKYRRDPEFLDAFK